jgi:hypothetical protein
MRTRNNAGIRDEELGGVAEETMWFIILGLGTRLRRVNLGLARRMAGWGFSYDD